MDEKNESSAIGERITENRQSDCWYAFAFGTIGLLFGAITLSVVLSFYIDQHLCTTKSPDSTGITITDTTTTATTSTTTESTTSTTTTTTTSTTTSTSAPIIINTTTPYYCGRIASYTLWQLDAGGLFIDVDTSACGFNVTPSYFASVSGTSSHWSITSYQAIFFATKNYFRVYAHSLHSSWPNTNMLSTSQVATWNVHWFGVTF